MTALRMRETEFNRGMFLVIEAVMMAVLAAPVGGQIHSSFAFGVVDDGGGDGGRILVVTNDGPFQVTGMLLSGTAPGAQPLGESGACAEGRVTVTGNGSISVGFDRMTPGMPCQLAATGAEGAGLSDIVVTADGFTGTWTEETGGLSRIAELLLSWWALFYLGWALAQIFVLYVIYNVLTTFVGKIIGHYWRWKEDRKGRGQYPVEDVIQSIKREYGVTLTEDEGTVALMVACGKDTLEQIEQYTGIRQTHIRHLIKCLRRRHLMDPVRIAPVSSLGALLKDGDVCRETHAMHGPPWEDAVAAAARFAVGTYAQTASFSAQVMDKD